MATKTSSGTQLYSILSRIWQVRQNTAAGSVFADALGVDGSDEKELINKITQLFKLINDTKEDAICLENQHEVRFVNAIQKIEKTFIDGNLLSQNWDAIKNIGGVTDETLDLIYSYGDKLIDKGKGVVEFTEEEIQDLYAKLNELVDEIIENNDIDQETKFSLISGLKKIEEVILNYKIRGASGLEKVGNVATGSFLRLFCENSNEKTKAVIHKVLFFVLSAILQTAIGNEFNALIGSEQKALPPAQATIEDQGKDHQAKPNLSKSREVNKTLIESSSKL
jgi:chorismate mutase